MFRKKAPVPHLPPQWLIVGLGNPGPEYRGTRHNVGFEVIDLLASLHKIRVDQGKQRAIVGYGTIGGESVALCKPLTFMNVSGESIGPLARSLSMPPSNILVIADDLDLPVGRVKIPERGGSGGHNGHKSLIEALGTQDYPRIKIGIGANKEATVEHVLGKFTPTEREDINDVLKLVARLVEALLRSGRSEALHILQRFDAGRQAVASTDADLV